MTVTRQMIALPCMCHRHDGKDEPIQIQIQARVCGGLAMHKSISDSTYTLTHLASGIAISTGLRLPVKVQEQALEDIASQMDWSKSYDEITSIWVHDKAVKEAVFSRLHRLHE